MITGRWSGNLKPETVMPPLAAIEAAKVETAVPSFGVPPAVAIAGPPLAPGVAARPAHLHPEARLREMVDQHVDFVARVLRNAGTPPSDIDDEVQRTFIIAARRLDDVRAGAEKSFLFRIALNLAAHVRRTMARRREVSGDQAPERIEMFATPEQLTDRKRMRELLDRVLDQMHDTLREVFVLHEFEEMNMSEIAAVLGIPRGTVASRLRRARAEFRERVAAIEDVWTREGSS
jgi:RNA polymerase sigma-70 factor (ECF subfamily)